MKERFSGGIDAIVDAFGAPALNGATMRAWLLENGVMVEAGDGYVGLATHEAEVFVAASTRIGLAIGD